MKKPILCLDFDGVCHSYTSGWQEGIVAMQTWFAYHWKLWVDDKPSIMRSAYREIDIVSQLQFPDHKPPAVVSIDDRAITFVGIWPDLEVLQNFKPWTKGRDDLSGYEDLKNGMVSGNQ